MQSIKYMYILKTQTLFSEMELRVGSCEKKCEQYTSNETLVRIV